MQLDLGNLLVHLRFDEIGAMRALQSIETKLNTAAARWSSIGIRMSAALTAPLALIGKKSVDAFASFEQGLAMVSTMLDKQSMNIMPKYSKALTDMMVQYGEGAGTLTKGLYDILSATIAPTEALKVLESAVRSSKAGMTDTATATRALVGILNAYGMSATEVNRVSDILFATVKRGVLTYPELADSIGRVTAVAAIGGVKLEELGAAIATITRGGLNAEMATTALRGIITEFLNPTKEAADIARQYGLELSAATLKADGLLGVLKKLGQLPEDVMSAMIGKLMPNARALTGFAAALKQVDKMAYDYNLTLHSAGMTEEAFAKATNTIRFEMDRVKQSLYVMSVSIGQSLVPTVEQLNSVLLRMTVVWNNFDVESQQTIVHLGLIVAVLGPLALGIAGVEYGLATLVGVMNQLVRTVVVMTTAFGGWLVIGLLAGAAAYTLYAAWNQNLRAIKDRMQDMLNAFKNGLDWFLDTPLGTFVQTFAFAFRDLFVIIGRGWKGFISDIVSQSLGAAAALRKMMEVWKTGGGKEGFLPILKESVKQATQSWADVTTDVFLEWQPKVDDFTIKVENSLRNMKDVYLPAFGEATVEHWGNLLDTVKKQFDSDVTGILNVLKRQFPKLASILQPKASGENLFSMMLQQAYEKSKGFLSFLALPVTITQQAYHAWVEKFKQDRAAGMSEVVAMSEEAIRSAWDNLYSGLNVHSEQYFEMQFTRLRTETDLWIANADAIATQFGVEKQYVLDLIEAYKKEQEILLEIQRLKVSNSLANGFKAAGMQIRREIQTWGERAYDFTIGMVDTLESGLMQMARDFDNFGDHVKNILKEIYYEAVRIAFIRPLAQGMAGAFSSVGSGIVGLFNSGGQASVPVTPGMEMGQLSAASGGMAEGGIAWRPTIAAIAEKGRPELVTPLDQVGKLGLGGGVTVNVINESGVPLDVSRQEQYAISDERIIDVVVSRSQTDNRLQRAMGMRR